jgi:hypothetical protein
MSSPAPPPPARLVAQRCSRHAGREAVARCPECARDYCRECVTEHAGRVICATCLARVARAGVAPETRRSWRRALVIALRVSGAFLLLWAYFYFWARVLVRIPTEVHDAMRWAAPGRAD